MAKNLSWDIPAQAALLKRMGEKRAEDQSTADAYAQFDAEWRGVPVKQAAQEIKTAPPPKPYMVNGKKPEPIDYDKMFGKKSFNTEIYNPWSKPAELFPHIGSTTKTIGTTPKPDWRQGFKSSLHPVRKITNLKQGLTQLGNSFRNVGTRVSSGFKNFFGKMFGKGMMMKKQRRSCQTNKRPKRSKRLVNKKRRFYK
jgi:hypothetical protein